MMHVTDPAKLFVFCHESDMKFLSCLFGIDPILHTNFVGAFELTSNHSFESLLICKDYHIEKKLDKFYFWVPNNDPEKKGIILSAFFEIIGSQYEDIIDLQRNLENLNNLMWILSKHINILTATLILDYGCGTGQSILAFPDMKRKLIGFDTSNAMRSIANRKGLNVWDCDRLRTQSGEILSGVFSSYVMHLLTDTIGFELIWKLLKPDGVFVANFHKDVGLSLIDNCVVNLGGQIEYFAFPFGTERHGTYAVYTKKL